MDFSTVIREKLSKVNTIVEGFMTVGITAEDIQEHSEHKISLMPKVLSKFPPDFKTPDTLPMFCFPWGIKVIRSNSETTSENFNFILTDENGVQLYCAAMMVFESPGSTKQQAKILQTEASNLIDSKFLTKSKEDTSLLSPNQNSSHNYRSQSASKAKKHKRTISKKPSNEASFRFLSNEYNLVPKCLVLLSKYPFLETMKKILVGIFKLTRTKLVLPIECYILHLFLLVPLPPRGCIEVVYQVINTVISIKIPPVNRLPLFDCNMTHLFHSLSIATLLSVFTHMLLEESVIFLSSSTEKLAACSFVMINLLYPFRWNMMYVPLLPGKLIDYLYSPVKYIYGLHSKYKEDVLIRCNSDVCIVDLDSGKIESNDEMINIHAVKQSIKNVQLPEYYTKKVVKRLTDLTRNKNGLLPRIDSEAGEKIRNVFYQFFVSILRDYKQFLNTEKQVSDDISSFFDHEGFIVKNKTDKDFFRLFFKTQMFANFCDKIIRCSCLDQHLENLMFNEHIIAKKNRMGIVLHKKPTHFISDTSQAFRSKYVVPQAETCFSKTGSHFYYTFTEIDYEALEYYGMPIKFHPKLTENPVNISEPFTIKRKNTYKPTLSHTIFMIWMQIWAATLWTQDESEHNERVTEVLTVLEKMNKSGERPSITTYTFLIEACFNVNPSIALSIFSYMNTIKVLVDASAVMILQKVVTKLFSNTSFSSSIRSARQSLEIFNDNYKIFSNEKALKRDFNKISKKLPPSRAVNLTIVPGSNISNAKNSEKMIKAVVGFDAGKKCFGIEQVKYLTLHDLDTIVQVFLMKDNKRNCMSLEELRENSELFWNLVWHFNDINLPYKFFVPYEREHFGDAFKIILVGEESLAIDITPTNSNDKATQTDLGGIFLESIL